MPYTSRKLFLVPRGRDAVAAGARPRRYRVARLQVNPPPGRPPESAEHLKRSYD